MSAREDIVIEKGGTFRLRIECFSIDNQIIDLSDVTEVRSMLRYDFEATDPLLTFTGVVTSPATDGVCEVYASDTDTAALAPGRYVWDVELVFDSGDVLRLLSGIADVTSEATYG